MLIITNKGFNCHLVTLRVMSRLLEMLHKKGQNHATQKQGMEENRKLPDVMLRDFDMVSFRLGLTLKNLICLSHVRNWKLF